MKKYGLNLVKYILNLRKDAKLGTKVNHRHGKVDIQQKA